MWKIIAPAEKMKKILNFNKINKLKITLFYLLNILSINRNIKHNISLLQKDNNEKMEFFHFFDVQNNSTFT